MGDFFQDMSVASHECGHALVGLLLGLPLRIVQVEPGLTTFGGDFQCEPFAEGALATAGMVADYHVNERPLPTPAQFIAGCDKQRDPLDCAEAKKAYHSLPDPSVTFEEALLQFIQVAGEIIRANPGALDALINALYNRRELRGTECCEILAAHGANLPETHASLYRERPADEGAAYTSPIRMPRSSREL